MPALDHIVFNTRDRMDQVAALFERLGFTVAPRGHHTLGSINHVIVLGSDYLELLGYPPGNPPPQRPELAAHPIGLMATVLATPDADATRADLLAHGLQPRPVQSFSRPVDLGNGLVQDAAFRVTRLEPDAVPGTWFYYCQHLTRDLVWRQEWQAHANGATAMSDLDITIPDLVSALPLYRACMLAENPETLGGGASSAIISLRGCNLHLREAAGPARMLGLTFRVASIKSVASILRRASIAFDRTSESLLIDPAATFGAKIQFAALAH